MKKILTALLMGVFFFTLITPLHALDVPKSDGFVTDLAEMLTKEQEQELEESLKKYGQGNKQIAVLIINSLEGEDIDSFGTKVAHTWGVGQKGKDSGVLLTIVKDDRKLRIDVGYGLEGALPDGLCGSIIRRNITPEFKAGNYYAGITEGIKKIQQAIAGEYTEANVAEEEKAEAEQAAKTGKMIGYIFLLVVAFIAAWIISSMTHPIAGSILGAIATPLLTVWLYNPGLWVLLLIAIGALMGYFSSNIGGVIGDVAGTVTEVATESSTGSGGGNSEGGFGGGSFGGGGASGGW